MRITKLSICSILFFVFLIPMPCSAQPQAETRAFCPLIDILLLSKDMKITIIHGENAASMDIDAAELVGDEIASMGGQATILNARSASDSVLKGGNLILIGGPVASSISNRTNNYSRARLARDEGMWYVSLYPESGARWGDRYGLVAGMANPWNENYTLIYVAGVDRYGTMAASRALLNMKDESYVWAALVLCEEGQPLVLRKLEVSVEPPIPQEVVFLNATKPGSVPQDVLRAWVFMTNTTGWHKLRNASEAELVFNDEYNAFFLEKNVNQSRATGLGENVSMFLARYVDSNKYSFSVDPPWGQATLNHTPRFSSFSVTTGTVLIYKNNLVSVPWSAGNVFIEIETIEADGTFEMFLVLLRDGDYLYTDRSLIDLDITKTGQLQVLAGPDDNPTTLSFWVSSASSSSGWAKLWLSIDFGYQPNHLLNFTDPTAVGDDFNLTLAVGPFAQYAGNRLWIAKTSRVLVPYCEGLVREIDGYGLVDSHTWWKCKQLEKYFIFDGDDWLVATLP